MRKQTRRLWFGEWQRDEEPGAADTVLITPDDDGSEQPPTTQRRDVRRAVAGVVALAALCALVFALASGSDDTALVSEGSQQPPAQAPQVQPPIPQAQPPQGAPPQGFGGPDLTGDEATKAAEAAVAKFPGDVERVTHGPTGGGYVVHVIQPDGNEVHVVVGDDFKVQGSDANSGPRGFGSGTSQ